MTVLGRLGLSFGGGKTGVKLDYRRVKLGDAVINYAVAGAGHPIILIHGLAGSHRWWQRTVQAFARQGRVYSIDLVGFGESRGDVGFDLEEGARYIAQWMEYLDLRAATVIGHSMGGYIAAELAADYPDKVAILILVDAATTPLGVNLVRNAMSMAQEARRAPLTLLPTFFDDVRRAGFRTIWQAGMQLCTADIRPKLARIQQPTLLVWGEKDMLTPISFAHSLVRIMPNARLVTLDGCGHAPHWERAEEFTDIILAFIKSHRRKSGIGRKAAAETTRNISNAA
ncbi:MAG: alpha/beta fold hydrolase [Anaerolineae bacterium]